MSTASAVFATAGACLLALPAAAVGLKQAEVDQFRSVFAVDFISSVTDYRLYIEDLYSQVSTLVREGKTLEEVKAAVDLSKYRDWDGFDRMSQANVNIEGLYRDVSLHRLPNR